MLNTKQIFNFITIFILITSLSHFYMFKRISNFFQLKDVTYILVGFIFSVLWLLMMAKLFKGHMFPEKAQTILNFIVYTWMGIALLMFVTLVASDLILLFFKLIPNKYFLQKSLSLHYFLGMGSLIITGFLVVFSLWKGLQPVTIKRINIVLERLPQTFDGLRIVQITDLHVGPLHKGDWLKKIVDKINALKPDLIVITGDLVDGSVTELHQHIAPLADLKALYGTFFVTGNHEYYSGVEEWCAFISKLGIHVLRNERISIEKNNT
ncbi:MAG: metallophosphoesterase, partial [Francisellaceae bacterium]|nr:metallophosphoesterase [Francisellaceae bacterium]